MSTKTTLKRIALVAVSALGFGVLVSVVPASAGTTKTTVYTTDISLTSNKAAVAGSLGGSVVHSIRFQSNTTANTQTNAHVVLVSKPATSQMAYQSEDGTVTSGQWEMAVGSSTTAQTSHDSIAGTVTTGTAYDTQSTDNSTSTGANAAGNKYYDYYIHAWYDLPGTYVWSIRDESTSGSTTCGGIDYCETFTVVVSGASSGIAVTGALSAFNSSSVIQSTNAGSIVKVTLTDASGNGVQPDSVSGVTIDPSGSGKIYAVNGNTTSAAAGAPWSLGNGDFNSSGVAFVNITNAVEESISVSLTNNGFSSFTAPSAITLTFRDATNNATTATPRTVANGGSNLDGTSTPYYYDATAGSKTTTWSLDDIAAESAYDYVTVTDSTGFITGRAGLLYAIPVARTSSTKAGQFSVVTTATSGSYTFSVNATAGTGITATAATRTTDLVTVTGDNRKVLTGTTNTFSVLVEDQFGKPRAAQTVTASIAGRNSTVAIASAATDADGYATLSYKDASTSTTSMVDTITFTSGTVTDTAIVTFAASLGVSTVLLTTPHTTSTGVTETVKTYTDISAGDGAEAATGATVTATVKDAAGVLLSYVPVTFTVSPTSGAAVLSTNVTVYTGLAGTASAKVYGWVTGTYTVTATAGGVSDDAPVNFAQVTAGGTEARNITATVSGNTVVAKVTDRFGNAVYDAPVRATRTGTGSFNGVSTASGNTNRDGVIEFVVTGGPAEVTVFVGTTEDYGQTDAIKGNLDGSAATGALTAYTAGTALVAEEGVGASFDAAGNNSVKVSVTASDASTVAAEAAADAAAEAIDAANAATDAANLAAEAADAATVAAEEARDAADAATAAVEELSTQVATLMAALRAQITTLANTVAKIAKKVRA